MVIRDTFYDTNAARLTETYRSLSPSQINSHWIELIQVTTPGFACDIGAGSGRDGNWLAEKGWDVIAVEPSRGMRELAIPKSHPNVTWLDDSLPELSRLRALGHRFDLVLLSAVWMHVPPGQRERAFRILTELLKPGGTLVITLRHGSDEQENRERGFHPVSAAELAVFAQRRAVVMKDPVRQPDQTRAHVEWETVVFTIPDDGTGSLPLLRHIIVNDNKSASYKLGLLRVLTRIAESAPGVVMRRSDDWVEIPLGIVGLYWLKQYKPLLVDYQLRERPESDQGYGFAREAFWKLAQISPYDLRVGGHLAADHAAIVTQAIRDACANITTMPTRYITWPGRADPVFEFERRGFRFQPQPLVISAEYLARFGVFRIPAAIWQTLGQYACWLEPAILREWAALHSQWNVSDPRAGDQQVFAWEEGRRDTSLAAGRLLDLRQQGVDVPCVWSDTRVREANRLHIDHCFPWSRWFNNDLWNLLPARSDVNLAKGDKLPSALALSSAHGRILDWWDRAWLGSPYRERFLLEAAVSLPTLVEEPAPADIYQAMLHQRARLKADQQLAEWTFGR